MAKNKATRRREAPARSPDNIDRHVGQRMRVRRALLGMSQEQLAGVLKLTFQQIQKYERGANRISASRLYQLAQALGVEIGWFFEALPPDAMAAKAKGAARPNDRLTNLPELMMDDKDLLDLVKIYFKIEPENRKRIRAIVKTLAD